MALGVVRMKRKAFEEPAEALVIALKKSKTDEKQCEIHLTFAATITKKADFECKHIEAAISRDKQQREFFRQNPKQVPISSTNKRIQYFKAEQKLRREQVVACRRLILAQSNKQDISEKDSADQQCQHDSKNFVLYDIIEESEDLKSSKADAKTASNKTSTITCNDKPLVKVSPDNKSVDYVFDVYYITKGNFNEDLTDGSFSIEPCEPNNELVHDEEDAEDEAEVYYDEDDSNDEDNWRNDYPDEDSDFEKERDCYREYEDCDDEEQVSDYTILKLFNKFHLDKDKESPAYMAYKSKVLEEIDSDDNY